MLLWVAVMTVLSVEVDLIGEKHDHEVAAEGYLELNQAFTRKDFEACIPQESKKFDGTIAAQLKPSIFSATPLEALDACTPEKCAFNFLPDERAKLSNAKNIDKKKALFEEFYKNRYLMKTPIDSERARYFIRSSDRAFDFCDASVMADVLNIRPLATAERRLSHVQYDDRMRPTTRLLQGKWASSTASEFCYIEALLFSNHYDQDRVETWNIKSDRSTTITMRVRHRIDLLNSFFRRLNKATFRKQIQEIVKNDLQATEACLLKRQAGKK